MGNERRSTFSRRAARLGLAAWFVGMVGTSAILLARHLVALPATPDVAQTRSALAPLRKPEDGNKLLAVHVLYGACRCSQRIADHLIASDRPTNAAEVVLLVGDDDSMARKLEARRFRVIKVGVDELEAYRIAAAPLLVVLGPDGGVRYSGGYTERKQGPAIRDLEILAAAEQSGRPSTSSLPVFGCAVATELRRRLDPTGIF